MSYLTLLFLLFCAVSATAQDRYIPHLAQGHGWQTILQVINTCPEPVPYNIAFHDADGQPMSFVFEGRGRFSGIYHGDSLLGRGLHLFHLSDTGSELLQGAAVVVEDGRGCIAVDTLYIQARTDPSGNQYSLYATIPLAQAASDNHVLTFLNRDGCQTHMALAGTGAPVRIEAQDGRGNLLGEADLGNLHHTAFQLSGKIPETDEQWGMLRIRGEAAVVGMDFCSGTLMQFRLPHIGPNAVSTDTQPEVESLDIRVEKGASFSPWTYKIKLTLRNPAAQDQTYRAKMIFKDSEGFLVTEAPFWPGRTGDPFSFSFCVFGECDMFVPAGETREFLGNIRVDSVDAVRVDLDESELSITAAD